jgi:hypothetical protein
MPGLVKMPKSDVARMYAGTQRGWFISTGERTDVRENMRETAMRVAESVWQSMDLASLS